MGKANRRSKGIDPPTGACNVRGTSETEMALSRRYLPLILLMLLGIGPSPAVTPVAPDEGKELSRYLLQHGYGVTHLNVRSDNSATVTALLNGSPVEMVVDTGCAGTCLNRNCANRLGLNVVDSHETFFGVGGPVSGNGFAKINSFKLNSYEINRLNIIRVLSKEASLRPEGLFGYDCLHLNSVLLPVGAEFLFFRPGPASLPSIDVYLKAMGFQAVPLTYSAGGLRISGKLNGHPMIAIVDSGCAYSLFDRNFVKQSAPDNISRRYILTRAGIDGKAVIKSLFRPDRLTFGTLDLSNVELFSAQGTTLPAARAQALLGYDLLTAHKAIIDLGHNVLWMK